MADKDILATEKGLGTTLAPNEVVLLTFRLSAMKDYPLITCVLPTKNRAHLLRTCIPCILNQSFSDFELVVIDNDDSSETREFLATLTDPRLSVVRTGGLNMPQNWQVALASGTGEYIIVVEDKMHFRINALEIIANAIKESGCDVVTWRFEQFLSTEQCGDSFSAEPGPLEIIPSERVLSSARKGEWRLLGWAGPRGLNSAIRRSALNDFESKWGVPASRAISPDYTLVFSMLMSQEEIAHVSSVLANVLANSKSTGGAALVRGALMRDFLRELGMTEAQCSAFVPVQFLSPVNAIYNDLLHTSKLMGRENLVDMASYFKNLSEEIFVGEDMRGDLRENRKHLIEVFHVQPLALQARTLKYIIEQTFIKIKNGYPAGKAFFRSYHQLKNLGFLPF